MIRINLAAIPEGHTHQEYEWELGKKDAPEYNDSVYIKGVFEVSNRHKLQYDFNGSIEFTLKLACDRCAGEFSRDFRESLHFVLKNSETDFDDLDILAFTTMEADITDYIRDIVLTAIPMKVLCKEDCRGLCVKCGMNLNKDKCDCRNQED